MEHKDENSKSQTCLPQEAAEALQKALEKLGLRSTQQREHVFAVLLDKRDHPTADEVFSRSKATMPAISLATVYNCLEVLVDCGLVKQVNVEREPSRYCPNLLEHAHFHCKGTGRVYDIPIPPDLMDSLKQYLPIGYQADSVEIAFHGSQTKE